MSSITAVTLPNIPVAAQIERAKLLDEITAAERELERLRIDEMPHREDLARHLETLAYICTQAAHRIRTNQFRDGRSRIDTWLEETRDAERSLVDLFHHIELRADALADLRSTYHDTALWEAAR